MEPLAISMAIAGLLLALENISTSLSSLISNLKSTHTELTGIKKTLAKLSLALLQLQHIFRGRIQVPLERSSLIFVDQVVVSLTLCVVTFSDFEVAVKEYGSDGNLDLTSCKPNVQELITRVGLQEALITLMVTILTCKSTHEAEGAADKLPKTIKSLLANKLAIAKRLASVEFTRGNEYAIKQEAEDSKIERKFPPKNFSGISSTISPTAGRIAPWCTLYGLKLSDRRSTIELQALPIYSSDINNGQFYEFGKFDLRQPICPHPIEMSQNATSGSKPGKRSIRRRLLDLAAKTPLKESAITEMQAIKEEDSTVLENDSQQGAQFPSIEIFVADSNGKLQIQGYVPIITAVCGIYLCTKGTETEEIFFLNGSAKRVVELQTEFNSGPYFGKYVTWEGYTVHDAASLLLQYLKTLPEPVIPFDQYERFIHCLSNTGDEERDHMAIVSTFREAITVLPPLSRTLLLYLLSVLASFAAKSEQNHMTASRLVAVFQPSLLSESPHFSTAEDYQRAASAMVFLVENQTHFPVGMRHRDEMDIVTEGNEASHSDEQPRAPKSAWDSSGGGWRSGNP